MPMKASGRGAEPRVVDRWDGGVGWIAHPEEGLQRASHALAIDGEVWVVEPVDAAGIDDLFADLGTVAGVVVLLGRHERDAAAIARRHDVPVHAPRRLGGLDVDVPVERFEGALGDTGYRLRRAVDLPGWREGALWDGETLVVADVLGTADHYLAGDERLGVHPALRPLPPRRRFGDCSPERVLVGHGAGVFEDAAGALDDALRGARRRLPRLYAGNLRLFLP